MEQMIRNEDRQVRAALDALIACYLNLTHGDGMPLVEDLFLKNTNAEYTDTYAAIMALRFHGQETKVVPKARLTEAMRHMLDRPQLADLVIPDLARWQDWSVMDRLVKLFKNADDDSIWVRVPVINYLRACPLPEAKTYIEELAKIDPEAVKRASQFFPIGAATPPAGAQRPKTDAEANPPATPKAVDSPKASASPEATSATEAAPGPKTEVAVAKNEPPVAAAVDPAASSPVAGSPPQVKSAEVPADSAPPMLEVKGLDLKDAEPKSSLLKINKPLPTPPLEADAAKPNPQSAPAPVAVVAETGNRQTVLGWAIGAGVAIFCTLLAIMRGNRKRATLVTKAQR
jgi:hypothetical protein